MATYGAHIRCSHVVSAEQKFPWKNTTSFTSELLCSALTGFHQLLVRAVMMRPWTSHHASNILAPWWASRDTIFWYCSPGRSPSFLVSLFFGFPVRMMGVGVLGTTSFQEILCSAFLEASQSYKVSEH